jgi:hypothetical protein
MPFTPSHVAAVLPFTRGRAFPAALVIGSMAPDLFFYVPLPIPRDFTHSWAGVFTVDLVFGVLLFLLWRVVFREPVTDFLPLRIRRRLATVSWRRLRAPGESRVRFASLLVGSLLIGTMTHIAWDSFTHLGWPVIVLPALQAQLGPLPLYTWLQYASSLVGAIVVAVWAIRWLRRAEPTDAASLRMTTRLTYRVRSVGWALVILAGLATSLGVWAIGIGAGLNPLTPHLVFLVVTIGLAGAALLAVLLCLAWLALPVRPATDAYRERSTATTLPSTSA